MRDLPRQVWDRLYRKQESLRADSEAADDEEPCRILKGRTPATYGIDNYKFNAKASEAEKETIRSTDREGMNEAAREEIFNRNRKAISQEIRESKKKVQLVVKGFFESPLHLRQQFTYFSGVSDVRVRIAKAWKLQIKNFESYIRKKDVKKERVKKIDELRNTVMTEYEGVQTILHIWICRLMAELIDKHGDGKTMFLFEHEEISTSGPFIKVLELPDR